MALDTTTEDRLKVLTQFGKNLVVEAGAGTGKTSSLIKRIGVAVLAQNKAVEKIVALTFTEKAAAEIKSRLISAFHQTIQLIEKEQTHQTAAPEDSLLKLLQDNFSLSNKDILPRVQEALAHLDRAGVGTIHGFCADILRTFPLEAGLSPQAEIDSGAKAEHLFNTYWNEFLDHELGLKAPRAEQWQAVLPEISLAELKSFTQQLCSGKIEQYDYFSHADMLAGVCEEKARRATAWSTAFLDPKKPTPRKIEKALSWAGQTLLQAAAFLRKQNILPPSDELPPTALPSEPPKGWEEDAYESARNLVQFALKIQPDKQRLFCQAFALVKDLAGQIRAAYEREGILSFDDLIVKTRNLVQHNLYVRRLLKEKFDVLFIDEFQDTDPAQGELLLFLAEEKTSSASRWQDVILEPGKLFVVGDPKQSIYRFRGADITAYELFTQLILNQGGQKCFLRNNFRSVPDIVGTANAVCRRAMVQQTAFQPAYEPIFSQKQINPPDAVTWLFIKAPATGPAQADDFRANQAEQIANWIQNNVGKMTLSTGEKLTYRDIVILVRAGTTSGPYTDALRRYGILFNADSEKNFFKRQEINDFLNFLRVIQDPSDTTALVGVLRSPLGGLTDEEIYQLAQQNKLSVLSHPAEQSLAHLYTQILSLSQKAGRMDMARFLEEVLDTTFLPELCAGAYGGEQSVEILTRLIQETQTRLANRPASLNQFVATAQDLVDNEPNTLNSTPAETLDAVSVMTVHKSKGLEAPVVILADLSRQGAAPANTAEHIFSWQYNMHGLRAGKICDANLAFLEEEQKKHERCEETRILYVALTRAKERLVLVGDERKGAEKAARAFSNSGLWPDGKSRELGQDEVQIPVCYFNYTEPADFIYYSQTPRPNYAALHELAAWKKAYQARDTRYDKLLAEIALSPSARVQNNEKLSPAQQAGAEIGSLCHRTLQILFTLPEIDVTQALEQAAQETGLGARKQEAAAIIKPFVLSALFRQLKACKLLAAEMPFSYVGENGLVENGIIDGLFELPDGKIWVVDYKTDLPSASGTQGLLEKYRPQLAVYQAAAQKIFPEKAVRCSAVFVRAFAAEDL
ncbi:MAG: UvrD-helicase domain-containing protein [Elusimicrobiaceae bacterium]|nr:UvrD-helicase domain-containing protein [Elusimicrobiaceae bacterium]